MTSPTNRFTVFHVEGKPINPNDRIEFELEWDKRFDELLPTKENRPDISDKEGWEKVSTAINDLKEELIKKYPIKATWTIHTVSQMMDIVSKYGSVVICKEGRKNILYLYPLPADLDRADIRQQKEIEKRAALEALEKAVAQIEAEAPGATEVVG